MSIVLDPADRNFDSPGNWEEIRAVVERTTVASRTGAGALWLVKDDPTTFSTGGRAKLARDHFGPVVEGRTYEVSMWARLTSDTDPADTSAPAPPAELYVGVAVTWLDSSTGFSPGSVADDLALPLNGEWTRLSMVVVPGASLGIDELEVQLELVPFATADRYGVLIDDFDVVQIPTTVDAASAIASTGGAAAVRSTSRSAAGQVSAEQSAAGAPIRVRGAASSAATPGTARIAVTGVGQVRGTQRSMPDVIVEAAVGQPWVTPLDDLVWTPIPNCVRWLRKQEGRSHRLDAVEPGMCRLIFDNRDAALDPSNVDSPLWAGSRPGVDYGTWVRVSLVLDDATEPAALLDENGDELLDENGAALETRGSISTVPWFVGTVDRLHLDWDLGDAVCEVDLVDALGVMAQRDLAASALREVVASAGANHLWPMSESGARIQDILGDRDGSWSQAITTGESLLPHSSTRASVVPQTEHNDINGAIPSIDLSGSFTFGVVVAIDAVEKELADEAQVAAVELPGPNPFQLIGRWVFPSGPSWMWAYAESPLSSGQLVVPPGTPLIVVIARDVPAGVTRWACATPLSSTVFTGTISTVGNLSAFASVGVRPDVIPPSVQVPVVSMTTRMQDMFLIPEALASPALQEIARSAFWPWASDDTAARFERMCDLAGLPAVIDGAGWPDCSPAVIERQNTLTHAIRGANGDGATITIDLDTGAPMYRGTDPTTVVMWWDTTGRQGAPVRDLDPRYGIDRLAATATVRRGTGEAHTATDPTTPYPPSATVEIETLLDDPAAARNRATEIVVDRRRPRWAIDRLRTQGRDARVPPVGLLLRPGDQIGVLAHPPGRSTLAQVASVERVEHTLDWGSWSWDVEYGVDRVTQFVAYDDLLDRHSTYDDLPAVYDSWFDVLASGTPNPPEV